MKLSFPVKKFIEDNIIALEEGDYDLFFYVAMFSLPPAYSEELATVCKVVLDIDVDAAIKLALVEWCKDYPRFKTSRKVEVNSILIILPHFGYDMLTFREMLINAVKEAYPNKTMLPDSYGIEYFVEKQ